jgi:hypothetical protein
LIKKTAIIAADPIDKRADRTGLIGSQTDNPITTAVPAMLARMARLNVGTIAKVKRNLRMRRIITSTISTENAIVTEAAIPTAPNLLTNRFPKRRNVIMVTAEASNGILAFCIE